MVEDHPLQERPIQQLWLHCQLVFDVVLQICFNSHVQEEICHVHVVIVQRWYQCIIYGRRGLVRKGMYPMTKQPIKVRRSLCTGEVCVRVACLEAGLFRILSRITLGMKRLSAEIHQPIHRLVCRYPAKEDERT